MKDPRYRSSAAVTTTVLGPTTSGSVGLYSPRKSLAESCPTGSWFPKSLCLQGFSGQRACSVRLARSVREWQTMTGGGILPHPLMGQSLEVPRGTEPQLPMVVAGSQCILHGAPLSLLLSFTMPPGIPRSGLAVGGIQTKTS